MTETRVPYRTAQLDLWSGAQSPPQDLTYQEQVGWLLEVHPETRRNDPHLVIRYWEHFEHLRDLIGDDATDHLLELTRGGQLTNPETIRRRRQEHQKLGTDYGHLRPDAGTVAYRRSRSEGGPPRGGRR